MGFHQLLVAARKTWLIDALSSALSEFDPELVKAQVVTYAPADAQRILGAAWVKDEHIFPTPIVLEKAPTLVGYYRLLLGLPQKTFYGRGTGMGILKSMEIKGTIREEQREALPDFCRVMGEALADLVTQLSPQITSQDVRELPILTLGQMFQGANNVQIGKRAIVDVYLSIGEVVQNHVVGRTDRDTKIRNASGRTVTIVLAQDPDVSITEDIAGALQKKVAIEVKGGTDKSNAHNRAGEAEKSHQKARSLGYREFWTVIATKGIDLAVLKRESPTTNSWFDLSQVIGRLGSDWDEFRSRIASVVGIPLLE